VETPAVLVDEATPDVIAAETGDAPATPSPVEPEPPAIVEASTASAPEEALTPSPEVLSTEYSVPEAAVAAVVEDTTPPAPQVDAPSDEEVAAENAAREAARKLAEKVSQVNAAELAGELHIGELLCRDILNSLTRPGRDPREDLPPPLFRR